MKYKLKSPIDAGQKEQVSALVRQIIPSHNVWCEPYFHSGEVFFKKKPSRKEIINDADGNVTNFYLMIRNRWEQLFFLMESTLQCDFFSRLAQRITDDEKADNLHKAWAFWLNNQKVFVTPDRWSVNDILPEPFQPVALQKAVLQHLSERLQNVYIANRCPDEMIHQADGPETLFFLAPRTKKQWKELEPLLPGIQGKFILYCEFQNLHKYIEKGLLYTDSEMMEAGLYTNFKRQYGLFD